MDDELTRLLRAQLPRHAAPYALLERLRGDVVARTVRRRRRRALYSGVAAIAAALIVLVLFRPRDFTDELVGEHVRLVARPVDVQSGGIHQVKPWFTGRLDFAPRVGFAGDEEFPLVGGSLARVDGKPAAAFVWKRRLHTITLFIFRAGSLPPGATPLGRLRVDERVKRGFDVVTWRDGDLGYSLVSDVSRPELETLAQRIAE